MLKAKQLYEYRGTLGESTPKLVEQHNDLSNAATRLEKAGELEAARRLEDLQVKIETQFILRGAVNFKTGRIGRFQENWQN